MIIVWHTDIKIQPLNLNNGKNGILGATNQKKLIDGSHRALQYG